MASAMPESNGRAGRPPLHPGAQRGEPQRGNGSESDLSDIREEEDSDFEEANGGSADEDDYEDYFSGDSSGRSAFLSPRRGGGGGGNYGLSSDGSLLPWLRS